MAAMRLSPMRLALAEAEAASARGEVPIGAVIVEAASGTVIAAAGNRTEADHDPTAGIPQPRLPRSLPRPLPVEDVRRLLEAPDVETLAGARDRAILELLYGSGLRISELTGLDVDDVDLEEGSVRVLGKGGRNARCRWGRSRRTPSSPISRAAAPRSPRAPRAAPCS